MINNASKNGTTHFEVHVGDGAKQVLLAGSFNGWKPEKMAKRKGGTFVANKKLAPGEYRYRFVIDGQWTADRDNPVQAPNPYGSMDSVVQVAS